MNLGGPGGGNAKLYTIKPVFYSLFNSVEFFVAASKTFLPNFWGENYKRNDFSRKCTPLLNYILHIFNKSYFQKSLSRL